MKESLIYVHISGFILLLEYRISRSPLMAKAIMEQKWVNEARTPQRFTPTYRQGSEKLFARDKVHGTSKNIYNCQLMEIYLQTLFFDLKFFDN